VQHGKRVNYDQISETYDQHRSWEEEIPRRLLSAATSTNHPAAASLLEIGCGTGNVTHWLRKHWPGRVIALDASAGMLHKARQKLHGVQLVRSDARYLPLKERSVAGCVGSFVLHHLDCTGRAQVFLELQRVIAPGGGVAFLTSSHEQIRGAWIAKWFPSVAALDCGRFPDISLLKGELSNAGFQAITSEEVVRVNLKGDATHVSKARGRFISTLDLVPADEFNSGLTRMEAHLAQHGDLGDVSWRATIVHARRI
jgi:ubiquinone/menaquinone biosynthesis C-methylase UbiE